MNEERSKDDYYREAAQLLNAAERVGRDTGEHVNETLAFLTRGLQSHFSFYSPIDLLKVFNNWPHAPWTMHCGHLTVSSPSSPLI